MKVAVIGATGMVGGVMLQVLEERLGPAVDELLPAASERSTGKSVQFMGREVPVISVQQALDAKPDIALFSAGGATSLEWAPKFAGAGTIVIDNSSAWRMDTDKLLVVPEINGALLQAKHFTTASGRIIANPNCSTIQLVMTLAPLHARYQVERVVVSTYQSVTGTGMKAVRQLDDERNGREGERAYPYRIDGNVLARCDDFLENGYTKEEMKLVKETRKILDPDIRVTATAVRVPVTGGHSESVNIQFAREFDIAEVRGLLSGTPGLELVDDPARDRYPMPLHAHGKDSVFVGRLRRDESQPHTLNLWIVADNLRKGAATNAVQIAELLVSKGLVAGKSVQRA
jgi:aspartate-semialdehyde dehydrogenase